MNHGWTFILLAFLNSWLPCHGMKGPPKIHPQERLITAEKGYQVKLPCPISANPEPLFEWRKDGRPVDDTWPRYLLRKHFLKIKSAREEDTGEFTCTGVNGFGQETFAFSLIIYDDNLPPEESQIPAVIVEVSPSSHSSVRIGHTVTLTCKATGVPAPKITWSKDGFPMHRSGTKLHVEVNSFLDAGLYTCTATNPLAMVTHNFTVNAAEDSYEREPEILQVTNATVTEGGNTTLQCVVRSALPPDIQWLKLLTESEIFALPAMIRNNTLHKDGKTYRYVAAPGHRVERENGTYVSKLYVSKASAYDAGTYVCAGATTNGFSYKEIFLTVIEDVRQDFTTTSRSEDSGINWLLLLIPACTLGLIVGAVIIVCKTRRSSPEKTYPAVGPQTNKQLESEDHSADTPLHALKPYIKGGGSMPPDIVYQDGSSFSTHVTNMCPINGSIRFADPYLYPENTSYLDPNYSDPYLEPHDSSVQKSTLDCRGTGGFEARGSEHSYARLTQSTQSSTSPLPPPPYAYQYPFSSPHSMSHPSSFHPQFAYTHTPPNQHTKYVVHYNL